MAQKSLYRHPSSARVSHNFLWVSSYGDREYLRKECKCTLIIGKREKVHCNGNKVCPKKVEVNRVYFRIFEMSK